VLCWKGSEEISRLNELVCDAATGSAMCQGSASAAVSEQKQACAAGKGLA
jgi:hypothetical protein